MLNIAKWNDTTWTQLGTGIGSTGNNVYALTLYNNELVAGGQFITAGGISANAIAKWNGTTWAPFGSGITGSPGIVMSLLAYNNELYAGGQFTSAGGSSANYIAIWNGSNWSPLGSGMGGAPYPNVHALVVFNNELIAGGRFTTAGGISATFIAKWGTLTGINNNSEIPKEFSLGQNYPNPFNPSTKIRFEVPKLDPRLRGNDNVMLIIYNSMGQEVGKPVNEKLVAGEYEITWNAQNGQGSSLPSGVYFYRLTINDASASLSMTETKKMILIK